jgi:hypothetical protein
MRFERGLYGFVCAALAACVGEAPSAPPASNVVTSDATPDQGTGNSTPDATSPDIAAAPDAAPAPDASASVDGVRVVREGCDGPLGPLAGTTCRTLEVRCGGLTPVQVALRVTPAARGTSARGVVVFGSGGAGTGLWSGPASADAMMGRLAAAGFTLVERQWLADRDQGWFYDEAGRGVPAAACRYATLLRYVDATWRHGTQPLCATGNSGGSAELGYAITRQDSGDLLDLAVPTSGPFHRADLACGGAADAAWQSSCRDLVRRHCPTCAPRNCTLGAGPRQLLDLSYGASTPCSGAQTAVDLARMRADSPAAPGVSFRLPHTRVALLVGEMDDGPYAALSAALYESLRAAGVDATFGSEATVHEFQSTDAGARRVEQVILADCVRRH